MFHDACCRLCCLCCSLSRLPVLPAIPNHNPRPRRSRAERKPRRPPTLCLPRRRPIHPRSLHRQRRHRLPSRHSPLRLLHQQQRSPGRQDHGRDSGYRASSEAPAAPLNVSYEVVEIKRTWGGESGRHWRMKAIATGGSGGYRYYHDDIQQANATFNIAGNVAASPSCTRSRSLRATGRRWPCLIT